MATDVGWRAIQWPGLEHVIVAAEATAWHAHGRVIMAEEGLASVEYEVRCDAGFRVAALTISVSDSAGGARLVLAADGDGHWQANGQARPDLDGCVDRDIQCTSLTSPPPARRLH